MPLSLRLNTGLPSASYLNLDSYEKAPVSSSKTKSKNKSNNNHNKVTTQKEKSLKQTENNVIKNKQERHAMQVHATKKVEVNSDCNPLVQSLLQSGNSNINNSVSISENSCGNGLGSVSSSNNNKSTLSRFSREEMLQNVRVLQLRNEFDPKRFYKRTNQIELEKAQLGTIIEGRFDHPSMRLTRKERKATFAEEVLMDPSVRKYTKKRFDSIQMKGQSKVKVYNDRNKKQSNIKNRKGLRKVQHDYGYSKNSIQERRHKAGETTVNIGGKKRPFKY